MGTAIIYAIVALVIGAALGFFARKYLAESQLDRSRASAERIVADAEKQAESLLKLVDMLEDHDDVQKVYANYSVSDEILARLSQ